MNYLLFIHVQYGNKSGILKGDQGLAKKGNLITEEDQGTLLADLARYERKNPNKKKLERQEWFEKYVNEELSFFKEGGLTNESGKSKLNGKSSKGLLSIDSKDEKMKNRIKTLQRNTTSRTVLAFIGDTITAEQIVLQKLQSIYELLDDLAESSKDRDDNGVTDKSVPKSVPKLKLSSDKAFLFSNEPLSSATQKHTVQQTSIRTGNCRKIF